MKVAIIEDEKPAMEKLERFITKYDKDIEIIARLSNIESSINWLTKNKQKPDLIFADIQLHKGTCFDIFEKIEVETPVISTTAYNEYAVKAFELNSIDYLLKPIGYEKFSKSMTKFQKISRNKNEQVKEIGLLGELVEKLSQKKQSRFMVKINDRLKTFSANEICCFYAEGRTVYLVCHTGRSYIIDKKLEELENTLNTDTYFRVNRSYIVNINYIKEVFVFSRSRLKIALDIILDNEIIVSREKVTHFKVWISGEVI